MKSLFYYPRLTLVVILLILIVLFISIANHRKEIFVTNRNYSQANILFENEEWIPYKANCESLKNSVLFYYPESWKTYPGGEQDVFDGPNDVPDKKFECMVSFGYPIAPGSRQDAYLPDVLGYLYIKTYESTSPTLDAFLKSNSLSYEAKEKVRINKINWAMGIPPTDHIEYRYFTVHQGKVYEVSLSVEESIAIDTETVEYFKFVVENFVNKIEWL